MKKDDCLFCKIATGDIPCYKIYEDDLAIAFLDIEPVHVGHTLVIPKDHLENIFELPEDTLAHMIKIAKKVSHALRDTGAEGININTNNGIVAGQTIFHSHIHIMPRYKDDGLMPWPKKNPSKEELEKEAKKIIQAL